ncbi:MAG TPA: hypothetical protein VGU68_12635 [Ktedonobacteraceae bacterium]|nr:hypothetical protein [Ktedonobacteraceae bacterium]
MHTQRRNLTWLFIVGAVFVIVGLLFLPMLNMYSRDLPQQAHPAFEWQIVSTLFYGAWIVEVLLSIIAVVPLVVSFIVLILSISLLRGKSSLKTVPLIWRLSLIGLIVQFVFSLLVHMLVELGVRNDLAIGFFVVLLGFLAIILATLGTRVKANVARNPQ